MFSTDIDALIFRSAIWMALGVFSMFVTLFGLILNPTSQFGRYNLMVKIGIGGAISAIGLIIISCLIPAYIGLGKLIFAGFEIESISSFFQKAFGG